MVDVSRMSSMGIGEKECEYVGKHQEALQGLLMSVSTQEVRESLAAEGKHLFCHSRVRYSTAFSAVAHGSRDSLRRVQA